MDLPIALGDVPTWLQAVGGLAQVGHVVWATQSSRASAFAERLRDELDLADDEIAQAIRDRPELAAIVLDGIEQAMRARTDEKRWLLARVVGAAFEGEDARLDEVEVFLRTAASVEAPDVRVLTILAKPRPDNFPDVPIVGAIRVAEAEEQLAPDQQVLLAPITASLIREGLIADVAVGTFDTSRRGCSRRTDSGSCVSSLEYLPRNLGNRPWLESTVHQHFSSRIWDTQTQQLYPLS